MPSLIRITRKAFEKKVRFLFVRWLLDLEINLLTTFFVTKSMAASD